MPETEGLRVVIGACKGQQEFPRIGPYTYDPEPLNVTILQAEFALGDEAVRLLRAIRAAYYADAKVWGMLGVGEDDARRFMRAYEIAMCSASPELQTRLTESEPQHTTLEVP